MDVLVLLAANAGQIVPKEVQVTARHEAWAQTLAILRERAA